MSRASRVLFIVLCCVAGAFAAVGFICASYAQILLDGWLPIPDFLPFVPKYLISIFGIVMLCIGIVLMVIIYFIDKRREK